MDYTINRKSRLLFVAPLFVECISLCVAARYDAA